ncbi:LysR family transcriptional regulator [Labrys wisconsinensis]|uniref:DNA-binding transcriptional LysR family regulator n=1 Tax=Labrys wisconsinensis TaxID=425677 RepID=A0ABU0JHS0_9HYPH|nr:LysR family transcriptional regulator [Labrys wisconsinensis]MDQ0473145.1 DNA-binding transcriptional LysR family regulator [Labrys wisconsinensis]
MVDHLSGLAIFVETVQAGGFSAAAVRLNLSRSAVGKTVARLERRLGARLFHRTTRSQALTEDGQAFYERCLRALAEIRSGEAMLESGKREVVGRLRVSMPVLFGRRCVAPILTGLARLHPGLELDLNFSDRLVDLMEDGFDLAIRNGGTGDGVGLMTRRIGSQRMTVCAAPAYLAEHGTPRGIADLGRHEAVVYGRPGLVKSWLFPADGAPPVAFQPRSRLRFDDLDAIADAAAAGAGLAWLPCWLIREHVRAGSLVRVLADHPGLVFDIHAVWPQTPHLPLRVRLAIDRLAEALPDPLS